MLLLTISAGVNVLIASYLCTVQSSVAVLRVWIMDALQCFCCTGLYSVQPTFQGTPICAIIKLLCFKIVLHNNYPMTHILLKSMNTRAVNDSKTTKAAWKKDVCAGIVSLELHFTIRKKKWYFKGVTCCEIQVTITFQAT